MSAALSISPKQRNVRPTRYPLSIEIYYRKTLIKLLRQFKSLALSEIIKSAPEIISEAALDRADAFGDWPRKLLALIMRIAEGITFDLIAALDAIPVISAQMNAASFREFNSQVKDAYGSQASGPRPNLSRVGLLGPKNPLSVNILENEPALNNILLAWEQDNIGLIKSVPANLTENLRSRFTQAFVNGTSLKELTEIVRDRVGVGESRAELIARDQIGRLTGQLAEYRQRSIGVDSYIWRTMQDERVRPTHRVRDGKTYKWSDPGIKPGSEIRCRCLATPIFPDFNAEDNS